MKVRAKQLTVGSVFQLRGGGHAYRVTHLNEVSEHKLEVSFRKIDLTSYTQDIHVFNEVWDCNLCVVFLTNISDQEVLSENVGDIIPTLVNDGDFFKIHNKKEFLFLLANAETMVGLEVPVYVRESFMLMYEHPEECDYVHLDTILFVILHEGANLYMLRSVFERKEITEFILGRKLTELPFHVA